jgi:spore coat protein CotH
MKKKSTRFMVLIISLVVTGLLAIGAIVFFAVKGGVLPFGGTDETKALISLNSDTTEASSDVIASEDLPDTVADTEDITEHNSEMAEEPVTQVSSEEETTEKTDETEENTNEERKVNWPHERKGVWAAISHAEDEDELDYSMSLFSDAYVSGKTPLRLFGGQYNRLVFYNDSDETCEIYFDPSPEATPSDSIFTLKAGEKKEFRFKVKENITANYALAYSCKARSSCYIQNIDQLKKLNREFDLPDGTVVHLEGASSSYDIHELYKIPPCEIVWKGAGVTGQFIALNTNATKWNDEMISGNYAVGGASGVELTGVSLLPSRNSFIKRELKYEQIGNAFKVGIPIDIEMAGTTKAHLNITANGNFELSGEGLNADGTVDLFKPVICKVTNLKGESHSYQLSASYESYNVPVVYITTSNGKMVSSKAKYIAGTFSMDADNVPGIDSIPEMTMQIKGRGHSTWKKDKKPFNIKFDKKVSILGLPSNRDWVMLANYFDPSMSRNYIAFELARQMNFDFTPSTFPVQVIYNGKYIGMYCIGDKVEIASGRVNQTKHSSEVDRDYLIEVRGYESGYRMGHSAFNAGLLREIAIKNPEPEEITPQQYKYISDYVIAANEAVVNLSNYEDYIDVDSLIDWFIIMELTYNCDGAFNRSVFIEKKAGQKLKFQPVWDFDLALGNVGNLTPEYDSWACSQNGFTDTEITWGTYLVQDKKFRDRLQKRWEEVRVVLRKTATESLKTMRHLMEKAGDANFAMWVKPGERLGWEWEFVSAYTSYEQHLDYIEDFFEKRFKVLDDVFIDRKPMAYFKDGILYKGSQAFLPGGEMVTLPDEGETEPNPETEESPEETEEAVETSAPAETPEAQEETLPEETVKVPEQNETPEAVSPNTESENNDD